MRGSRKQEREQARAGGQAGRRPSWPGRRARCGAGRAQLAQRVGKKATDWLQCALASCDPLGFGDADGGGRDRCLTKRWSHSCWRYAFDMPSFGVDFHFALSVCARGGNQQKSCRPGRWAMAELIRYFASWLSWGASARGCRVRSPRWVGLQYARLRVYPCSHK